MIHQLPVVVILILVTLLFYRREPFDLKVDFRKTHAWKSLKTCTKSLNWATVLEQISFENAFSVFQFDDAKIEILRFIASKNYI